MGLDKDVEKLLSKYNVFEPVEHNKVRCKLTGHDLPPRINILKEYIDTKKFQTAWEIHKILENNANVFDDLGNEKIGCRITKKVIAKDPADLRRHLNGKKFKKAIERGVTGDEDDELVDDESISSKETTENDHDVLDELMDREDHPEYESAGDPLMSEDNYDFAVMDVASNGMKRKTEGKGILTKKKKRKAE